MTPDTIDDLLTLDSVLPAQFYGDRQPGMTGLQRLLWAVLIDAIQCVRTGSEAPIQRQWPPTFSQYVEQPRFLTAEQKLYVGVLQLARRDAMKRYPDRRSELLAWVRG